MSHPTSTLTPDGTDAPGIGTKLSGGSLTTTSIVFMVIAAAAPLTVIGGALPIGMAAGNGPGFPTMYAVGAAILVLFSVGLTTMSRYIDEPGAFYSYVETAFGRRLGMGTAYLALLTYTAIQFAVYGFLGQQLTLLLAPIVDIPWWVFSIAVAAVVGYLGYRSIELSSKALGILLIAEIAIVVLIDVVVVGRGGAEGQGLNVDPFLPENIFSGAMGVGLMMAMAGLIGFESTTVFRSEARNPDRTIPRATYISVAVIGIFYTVSGWAVVQAWGTDNVLAEATANPDEMIATTAVNYLGSWAGPVVHVLLLTSLFACVLSFHNVLTRYQHAISHKRGLPRRLRAVHLTYRSPHMSSIVQTGTVFVLTVICALVGLDPVAEIFTWFSGLATFTIIILMLLVSVAVLSYFRSMPALPVGVWKRTVAPVLAFLGLATALYFIATNLTMLVGGNEVVALLLALSAPVAFVTGVVCSTFVPEFDDDVIIRAMEDREKRMGRTTG
ncbi:APC family permease [Corynebacterium glyciniphilum]|uniref:APC family permease n=1 Tax=Corynebacterium glyciniphilum TaxID=1404244 RepID=UPI00264C3317|nr:APC family permease [Corynebacterium glyciniphilum]MDN5684737.1 APC family permease [Corynebacterium glyciniphilum]MDN6707241.1 APC family permease [Corynebacterium glyciniphilum]